MNLSRLFAALAAGAMLVAQAAVAPAQAALSGQASQLTLFPQKPANWAVVDQAHGAKFTIQLLDNTTRNLSGAIKSTTNVVIAPIALDQSGTGTIKYSNGVTAPISGWVLGK